MDGAFDKLSDYKSQVFIFVDELEELNIASDHGKIYLNLLFSWLCTFQRKNSNYFFILASRKYAQLNEEDGICVADMLCLDYLSENNKTSFVLIQTTEFSAEARKQWIEEYTYRNNKYVSYSQIKKLYGKIVSAMKTPIFLFAFMRKYIKSTISQDMYGYYYYYSSFIEETIEGRFGLGQKASLIELGLYDKNQYKNILRQIAFSILKNKESYLNAEIYRESIVDEQPLLADELRNRKFEIRLNELGKFMPAEEYVKAGLINCYFFNMDARRVYFTDTNILFALAAEYIFESVRSIAVNNMEFQVDHLKQIELVRLYPHLVDYIIYLLQKDKEQKYIAAYLSSFVRHYAIRCHYIDLSGQGSNIVERILLLYVLFIKTNCQPYNMDGYAHILKEILYYVNAYKTNSYLLSGKEYAYTIERYFMKLHLHRLELKRANLKNYNFQGSIITDKCRFMQCNFSHTNISDVVMEDVIFDLCRFDNVRKFSLKPVSVQRGKHQVIFDNCHIQDSKFELESALFRNCRLEHLLLELGPNSDVVFENCFIKNLSIKVHNNLKSHIPQFYCCIFENKPSIPPFSSKDIDKKISGGIYRLPVEKEIEPV